jgi:septum formation protein
MLYLASRSPRRRQLLEQIGVAFRPLDIDVPEQPAPGEAPEAYVARVACDKARAGHARVDASSDAVLGSDTEVVLDGEVFGKPDDAAVASAMLRRLSGRTHRVVSCVCLVDARGEHRASCVSEVRFAPLDAATIEAYVATGESFGKAGGYAIQGRAAAFVAHLSGSYSGVMGLPLHETAGLLREAGLWPAAGG